MQSIAPFTRRMYQVCEDAPKRVPGYYPGDFRRMLDSCGGDFVPAAKAMLRTTIQPGLETLARAGALDISMEWVIANEPWPEFDDEDRRLARERLDLVRRMV